MQRLSATQAAKLLGVLVTKLNLLEKQGLIHSLRGRNGLTYSLEEINAIVTRRGMTVAEAAAQVAIGLQREAVAYIASTRKVFRLAIGALLSYVLLVTAVTTMFVLSPVKTAERLGIIRNQAQIQQISQIQRQRVLGVATEDLAPTTSPLQILLEPVTQVSLGLVRSFSPQAYAQVSERVIINPNDVLALDLNGSITPGRPIRLPQSSLLQVESNEIIANLNSEYLQGRQPGTNAGDLAIVGEGISLGPPPPAATSVTAGLTNANLSGAAGITNNNLANSNLTLTTSGPLAGGGTLSLGDSLTLSCPDCITSLSTVLAKADANLTFAGNTGSGKVSLGETLTMLGSGINTATYSGTTLTITGTEADTLASITARGDLTATSLTLNGGITTTTSTALTLDSGTTGGILIGTGANPKTINIGNTTGATGIQLSTGTDNLNFIIGPTNSSGKVQVGNSGSTTPDLLVLDTGTSDPTGTNGGIYYNSTLAKFRCYENDAWDNCITNSGSNLQQAILYDSSDAFINIPTGGAQVILGTVSITPTTATGDIYLAGWADVYSSHGQDQPFNLVVETTSDCTGTVVGNATVTYTIASGASAGNDRGSLRISGIDLNASDTLHSYSLCAAILSGTGDSDVINWGIEALVIDTGI